ncbi:hypothetical protein [Singulisphaera sp. PoT]|uniref:hypothetical protein n=1 Tax=Singulisphaera sp. PoT TaxID=3411797 RepID=UPI003BF5A276
MADAVHETKDEDDREDWDRSWSAMPHRRLLSAPRIKLSADPLRGGGTLVSCTISLDPPQYSDRGYRESDRCPICGEGTKAGDRLPASLRPVWTTIANIGIGVWVHPACFEACPEIEGPAPIPW